ncbi:MAG: pilus assembly protein PilV [Ramlibacter sp.]|nr:pilus assembly protein PilV [Ramlibacter sp.]
MRHSRLAKRHTSRGIALIEALVGILIFSIGILGLVGLQASMTRAQSAAKYRADAAYLASEIIGVMWVDKPNLASYVTSSGSACTYARCADWIAKVASGLPQGGSQLSVVTTSGVVGLTVTWSVANEGTRSYVLNTTIQ